MKRTKFVAANWKMNLLQHEAESWLCEVSKHAQGFVSDVVLFPSALFITSLIRQNNKESKIGIGAQNCSQHPSGAYTGEVSAAQLGNAGVTYVIVGHSERRTEFCEDRYILQEKMVEAFKNGLKPVFCCGEHLAIRENNEHHNYIKAQLEEVVFHFPAEKVVDTVIAYEPIWAIGTGINATEEQAQEMHFFIRQHIAAKYSDALAQQIRIIYGGSCKPANALSLFNCPDVDGGLIGGASLVASDFTAIVKAADSAFRSI